MQRATLVGAERTVVRQNRILVVEDEEAVQVTLCAILSDVGYDVVPVSTGADALDILESTEFDLILTDLRLDVVDGLQILAAVQQRWPETVTVLLTGYASLDSAVSALRAGAYDYLVKPCAVDDLLATVARGLERRHLAQDVRRQMHHLEISIDTARDLHSALSSQLESTQLALHERDLAQTELLTELATALVSLTNVAQFARDRIDAPPPASMDIDAIAEMFEQLHAEAERLLGVVRAALDDSASQPRPEPVRAGW